MTLQPSTPILNLHLEEAAYKNCSIDHLSRHVYVWVNRPSIIVGRLCREGVDYSCGAARRYRVPVYRRFTGGGAVYHDEGVLSVTLVGVGAKSIGDVYSFGTGFMQRLLEELGFTARVANEGDIVVGGCKVSGSAAHLGRDRFLYHATLIVDSDLVGVEELTPPRLDRIAEGVDPVKYNPCPLSRFRTRITLGEVSTALEAAARLYGRMVRPLQLLWRECSSLGEGFYEGVRRRLLDEYWTPCGYWRDPQAVLESSRAFSTRL